MNRVTSFLVHALYKAIHFITKSNIHNRIMTIKNIIAFSSFGNMSIELIDK